MTHELRFTYLHNAGRALTFPCDASGHVDLDALSDTARVSYQRARAAVGIDVAQPIVRPVLPAVTQDLK